MAHDHHHHSYPTAGQNRLAVAFFVTAGFMVAEIAGGIIFNSLALLADAGHMVSDVAALAISWLAIRVGKRSPTDRLTFGFKRSEILAALFNGLVLWAIVAIIFFEAIQRLFRPEPVIGSGMLIVAMLGLCVNLFMALLLFRQRLESLNIRAAYVHVLSDALGSVGAVVGAIVILWSGSYWVDPLISVLIGFLIVYSSWGLIKESVQILMEGVPLDIEIGEIEQAFLSQAGVCCIYDLHVWSISGERPALSAHVVLAEADIDRNTVLLDLTAVLKERFGIDHTTIQLETTHEMRPGGECLTCRPGTACSEFRCTPNQQKTACF